MFKKKPVYVILLVVFSLVLCADMATYLAFPGMESRTRMPGNFSTESMENFDGEAVRPEDFSSEIPSGDRQQDNGDEQGQDIPSENDAGAQNADDGAPTSTENFNSQDFSEESPFGGEIASPANGFLRFVKSAFLPILIVCLLADAFCVLMLIHLRKKHGKDDSPKSSDSIAPRKRSKKLWIVLLAMMPVIATALAVLPNQSANEGGGAISAEELVVSATVETGEIVSSFYGSGTLNDEEAAAATILSSVEVVSYAVKNGDTVSEGDPIAVIDRISAQNAIAELQDAMDALDEEIAQASADRISDTVQAPSAGRVKRIFAQENAGVADTMYEHGALILISLDGCMAVDVESEDACTVGQSVAVILSDGREEAGKVAEVGNGVVTVTLTDNGPEYGENVSVTDSDGKTIGSGELYIHSELKITGFSGTISNIHVSEESTVSEGKTLLTLADTEYVGAYHQLLEERETLLEEMKKLTVMYQDGYVYAECDGIISGIDSGAVGTELSSEEKGSSTLFSASYADETGGGTLLSKSRTDANNVALLRTGISLSGASSIRGLSNADALYAEPVASDSPESSEVSQSSNVQYAGKVTSVSYGTMQFRRTADPAGDLGYADLAGYDAGLFTIEAE